MSTSDAGRSSTPTERHDMNVVSHPAGGPAEADRCTFCAAPRSRCEQHRERDTLRQPCCVRCSHQSGRPRMPEALAAAIREEFMAGVRLGQQQGVELVQQALGAVFTANGDQPLSAEIVLAVVHTLQERVTDGRQGGQP